ncbi:helix-turn-helix domain-containing protein [Streptomyces sp. NPDC058751]|uniref:helix-turn-helix domain-containing protein n=1 Tax=Streptomyces sp. NPDC058751 TaxID=3346623 RepID=UPI00369FC481
MAAADEDVTRFAELLARLKTRTDRSYAALARRLDMNASTLHRYCAGEAVPLDFGVVERFAALCGASRQERVELHRLWILAVAERRRSRPTAARPRRTAEGASGGASGSTSGGEPNAPERAAESGAEGNAEDGTGGGPGNSTERGAGGSAGAESRTDSLAEHDTDGGADGGADGGTDSRAKGRAAERGGTSAPLAGPAPLAEPTPDAAGAADAPGTSGTTPAPVAPVAPPGTARERSPRAWYRRRPAVVSAVLGTAFLLTTAGFAAFSAFPGSPAHGSPGSGASSRRGPSVSPTGTSAQPSSPVVPFTWTVNSHVWKDDCSHDYVIEKPPGQVPPPPSAQDAEVWATAQDAAHGGETIVRVAVQGRSSAAVVLEALHVRVVRRAAPPGDGSFVYDTSLGCSPGITPTAFTVALDAHTPVPRAVPGRRGDKILPARRLPYRVSVEDPEVLLIKARTEHCACDWYLDLDWSSQGRTGTTRLDDHGRPFRTAGVTGLPRYRYADPPRRWMPEAPQRY